MLGRVACGFALAVAGAAGCAAGVQDDVGLTTFGPPPVGGSEDGGSGDDGDDGGSSDGADGSGDGMEGPVGACNDGEVEDCYSGPAESVGIGTCAAGTSTCAGGEWGACDGEILPGTETCNGMDDDCNGSVDDGLSAGGDCDTGMPGVCAAGTSECSGGVESCDPVTVPGPEMCDGADNDCNGQTDEGAAGGGDACSTGQQGVCAAGTNTCMAGAIVCVQNTQPGTELCGDGMDNNCDGTVDEGCNTCAHDPCVTGGILDANCSACVSQICAVDSFCCTTSWDALCVEEVGSVCGKVC